MRQQSAQSQRIGRTLAESTATFVEPQRPSSVAPNVVVIVLDDLGFAQLGCYGSNIATPHIDALAEHGLRYNNFHVTAACSPTRACLITGRNQHAVGFGRGGSVPRGFPGYRGRIPRSAGTISRHLRDYGYNTFAVGKWHLTPYYEQSAAGPFDQWPLGLGFERYYGFLDGMTNQWTPDLVSDNGMIQQPQSPYEGYHLTEDLASQAIRFIQDQQHAAPNRPFFMYFATAAPHHPHHVPTQWIAPYRGEFDQGWDAWRNETFLRQKELKVVPSRATLTARPSWVRPWDELSVSERALYSRQMEVYAGFITHTDYQVGRVIKFLDEIDAIDNTIVILLSDNGASGDGGPNGCFSRLEGEQFDFILSRVDQLGGFQAYNHYAWGWAWAGNTPFRLWKRYSWLGGVRVPMIIRWPRGISTENFGEVRTQFCHAIDIMPTILEAASVEIVNRLDGESQQPIDGESFLRTLNDGHAQSPRRTQYFESAGSRSIYHDGWKATTNHVDDALEVEHELLEGSREFDADKWSLFFLDDDFSEAHDLAAEQSRRLRQMVELWWREAGRNDVLPLMASQESLAQSEPHPYPERSRYVFLPDGGPILTASPFRNGFRLSADIETPEREKIDGIICAQGDWHGGWACYFLGGYLTVTFNFGGSSHKVVSKERASLGKHKVQLEYCPGSLGHGSVRVTMDGQEVGSTFLAKLTLLERVITLNLNVGKLLVGRDQGFPVSEDYMPPFPFTGKINHVVFEVLESNSPLTPS